MPFQHTKPTQISGPGTYLVAERQAAVGVGDERETPDREGVRPMQHHGELAVEALWQLDPACRALGAQRQRCYEGMLQRICLHINRQSSEWRIGRTESQMPC